MALRGFAPAVLHHFQFPFFGPRQCHPVLGLHGRLPPTVRQVILIPHLRLRAVAPRPRTLKRLPQPCPQAVAPRPLWRLPPPALVASSPPSSRPQAVAPRPLWRLPPPAFVASPPSQGSGFPSSAPGQLVSNCLLFILLFLFFLFNF